MKKKWNEAECELHIHIEKKRKKVTKSTIHNAVTALPNLYRTNSDNNGAGNDRKRDENVDPVYVCICARIMEMTKKTNPYCLLLLSLLYDCIEARKRVS